MRECGDCKACCEGLLTGSARGSWFGNLTPCKYLNDTCTIYSERPGLCRRFFCAWAQELLPEWMKPNNINVIVSVEKDNKGNQYLNAVSAVNIPSNITEEINTFVTKNNTYYKISKIIPLKVTNASVL